MVINNPKILFDMIGRRRLEVALGVKRTAVSNAIVRGVPSSWFWVLEAEAARIGLQVDRRMLNFIQPKIDEAADREPTSCAVRARAGAEAA